MVFVTERRTKPVLIFDADKFDAVVEDLGYTTQEAKADFLNVARPTYSKVARGINQPPPYFVAAVFVKLPGIAHHFFRAEVR